MVMSVDDYIVRSVEFRTECQQKCNTAHRINNKKPSYH